MAGDHIAGAVLDVKLRTEWLDAKAPQPVQFLEALLDLIVQFIHTDGAS